MIEANGIKQFLKIQAIQAPRFNAPRRTSGTGAGCAKSCAYNLLVESSSHLVDPKDQSAGDGYPRKAIEKPVLRSLGSRTFSHGLGRKRHPKPDTQRASQAIGARAIGG
jgi:hypothetical protein